MKEKGKLRKGEEQSERVNAEVWKRKVTNGKGKSVVRKERKG